MSGSLVSPAVVTAFKVCLKDYETLSTIDDFFMDLGFGFDVAAEAAEQQRWSSSRRARAAGYLGTLDLVRGGDARKLLNAIAIKLGDWERANEQGSDIDRLRRALEISRITWDGRRLTLPAGPVAVDIEATLRSNLASEAVAEEVERIMSNIDSDPAAAITASRALVEASCKAVLERLGQPVNDNDELPALLQEDRRGATTRPRSARAGDLQADAPGSCQHGSGLGRSEKRAGQRPREARQSRAAGSATCPPRRRSRVDCRHLLGRDLG